MNFQKRSPTPRLGAEWHNVKYYYTEEISLMKFYLKRIACKLGQVKLLAI